MKRNKADYKVVILGDPFVGKTELFNKLLYENGEKHKGTSIPYATGTIDVSFKDNRGRTLIKKVDVYDTAGQEAFQNIVSMYLFMFIGRFFKRIDAAIVMYDITKEPSFNSVSMWLYQLKNKAPDDCIFYILGNKHDLVRYDKGERKVSKDRAETFSAGHTELFNEISAINNTRHELTEILSGIVRSIGTTNPKRFTIEINLKGRQKRVTSKWFNQRIQKVQLH